MMSDGGTVRVNDEENHVFLRWNLDGEHCEQLISTEQGCGCWD